MSWMSSKSFAQNVSLSDLNAFDEVSNGWQIVGDVIANPLKKESIQLKIGKGILFGSASHKNKDTPIVTTKLNHGDIALEFEVLLDHDSSIEILLQGRYGLQLMDCLQTSLDCASIISPKSDEVSSIGYNARINVARVPGIWQHIKIVFNAPKFDENREKITNAKFVSIEHNGVVIHQNQMLSSPSISAPLSNEVSQGPIVFRINTGKTAIRNINFRVSSGQEVLVEDLTYKVYVDKFLDEEFFYGSGKNDPISLPDLTSYTPTKSGKIKLLNTEMTHDVGSDFALVFNGKMSIPQSGKYFFEVVPNGLGELHVGEERLFQWDDIHNRGITRTSVNLEEGDYTFKLINVNFGQSQTGIFIEGPGIISQSLHQQNIPSSGNSVRPILLKPNSDPLIQRSFILNDRKKLLSAINVGYSAGVHYTFDLATGSLIQVWRGDFGDVTSMWNGRGLDQILEPKGSVLSLTTDQQVLLTDRENIETIRGLSYGEFKLIGYDLNNDAEPIFKYSVNEIDIQDHLTPGTGVRSLTRSLTFNDPLNREQTIWYRIASASSIEQVTDHLFSIADKTYYVEFDENVSPMIKRDKEMQVLFVPISMSANQKEINYSLIW